MLIFTVSGLCIFACPICVCQNCISNCSAGNTLYKPVQTISTHFSHLYPCLFFCLPGHESVCLGVSLQIPSPSGHTQTHRHKHTNVLWPLCAHTCWREQTLPHWIAAGRWEIPLISSRFPSLPLISLPFKCAAMLESPVSWGKHFWHFFWQLIKLYYVFSVSNSCKKLCCSWLSLSDSAKGVERNSHLDSIV